MKKHVFILALGLLLYGCQNSPTQTSTVKETPVEAPTIQTRDYRAELDALIKESGLKVRNGDYYDIISFDTAYCQRFYDLWKDITESPYKNTSIDSDALAISVATAFYKEEVKSGKKKATPSQPKKKEWEVKIGCTKEYVLDAWGKPDHVATSESAVGKVEMLYYYDRHYIITILDGWVEEMSHYE